MTMAKKTNITLDELIKNLKREHLGEM